MIDMGAVLGGRATVGADCHIGAGAVLAGVVEPASATPVIVEDGVLVGANAVVMEVPHRQERGGGRRCGGYEGGRAGKCRGGGESRTDDQMEG